MYERILREIRSRHRTYISKVIQHPSNVMEVQIKKEKTTTRAGQVYTVRSFGNKVTDRNFLKYIFLSCPEISYFQWHPFTLTSAPEEDYISVHIRVAGDFTTGLLRFSLLSCHKVVIQLWYFQRSQKLLDAILAKRKRARRVTKTKQRKWLRLSPLLSIASCLALWLMVRLAAPPRISLRLAPPFFITLVLNSNKNDYSLRLFFWSAVVLVLRPLHPS